LRLPIAYDTSINDPRTNALMVIILIAEFIAELNTNRARASMNQNLPKNGIWRLL